MSKRFELGTIGAPSSEDRHRRIRRVGSLIAAVCGAVAALVVGYFIVGGSDARHATWAWVLLAVLVITWLTGFWWRWDSPDVRKQTNERERRGY
jgi:hypothetical protein